MATYDNKIWLLKTIRDAFIATDDTGLCEIVMASEDLSKVLRAPDSTTEDIEQHSDDDMSWPATRFDPYPDIEDSDDDDIFHGSEIRWYENFGGHRHNRSNSGHWLDKKEQALINPAHTKVTKWENPSTDIPAKEIKELFIKAEVEKPGKQKSMLSEQIQNCPELPHQQYLEYAKYDGTAQSGSPTKTFKIFMTMLPEEQQNYPIVVCIVATAKIRDLIGLTCYKYSIQYPETQLGSVFNYGLCIAEDDGEVDWAFPCLDSTEPCSKFGFTCLGLVDLKSKNENRIQSHSITEDGGIYGGAFQGFPKVMESGLSSQNPSRHNTGGSSTSEAVKFALQAVNEERKAAGDSDLVKLQSHLLTADAPQYKTYRVQMLRKVRANTPVQLGISVDRIEVEPTVTTKQFWKRSKHFLHSIDSVAWCQILEARANKTTFRIVYSPSHSANSSFTEGGTSGLFQTNSLYKLHDFESEHDTAKEIVEKVNMILDLRNSPCRREYKIAKEKKLQRGRSFHSKNKNLT